MMELNDEEIRAFRVRAEKEIKRSGDIEFHYFGLKIQVFIDQGKAKKMKCTDSNGCSEYYNL